MKPIYKNLLLFSLFVALLSCSEETIMFHQPPLPSESIYLGVMEVRKTDGDFATARILASRLEAGNYKIIAFPKAMELKSYYVQADAKGNISVEYKLEKAIEVQAGYEGTVFGVMRIINESRTHTLNVPVGFVP